MIDLHPGPDQLAAFRLGKLSDADFAAFEEHVAGCDDCCRQLKNLPDDSFVCLVRQSTDPTPAAPADRGTRTWTAGDTLTEAVPDLPPELYDHPRYQILTKLGHGGMGVVYQARHRLMDRVVALKVLCPRLLDRPASVERFRREVQNAARLSHANIVTAYDADQAGTAHFLVMEYVEGVSLARLVEERGPLPVVQACAYVRQAALGLQHACACGMVHRDIKPQNLMVSGAELGTIKILDFGLAHFVSETAIETRAEGGAADPSGRLTQASTVMGTPDYIAPEQARAAHTADIRADLYSLGCTLYFLLAGHAPFPHGEPIQKVKAHLEQTPRPLNELRPDVPAELMRVLERLLDKNPARRYQTPAELADALAPFTAPRPAPRPWRRLLVRVLAALVIAAAVNLAAHVLRPPTDNGPVIPGAPKTAAPNAASPPQGVQFNGKDSVLGAKDELRIRRLLSQNNLRQIIQALLVYHDTHKRFPPPAICDARGKPLLSWRVALLPFLEAGPLFKQFKLDEPWDSAHNRKLLEKMPNVYGPHWVKTTPPHATFYQAIVGPGADIELRPVKGVPLGAAGRGVQDFPAGVANTALVIEAAEPVPWTSPADLVYDPTGPLPKLGGLCAPGFHAAFADGAVRFHSHLLDEKTLRTLLTRTRPDQPPAGQRTQTLEFGTLRNARADLVANAICTWHRTSKWKHITLTVVSNRPQNTLTVTCSEPLVDEIRKLVERLEKEAAKGREAFLPLFNGKDLTGWGGD